MFEQKQIVAGTFHGGGQVLDDDGEFQSQFAAHLLRLGTACRQLRFGSVVGDEFLRDYACRFARHNTLRVGYSEGGVLRASAELRAFATTWAEEAEASFIVEADWRGRGIGSHLMRMLLDQADSLGLGQVHVVCATKNRPMQRIASRCGACMRYEDGDCFALIRMPKDEAHVTH